MSHAAVSPPSTARVAEGSTAQTAVAAGVLSGSLALGGIVALAPKIAIVLVVLGAVTALVWRYPAVAAYVTLAITPLVAGLDRGRVIPVLRPNEALVALFSGILIARALLTAPPGWRPRLRLNRVEIALVAMALANSVVILVVMVLRGQQIQGDDLSYALVLWKYLAGYALIRVAVTEDRQVRRCLWVAMCSAGVVGVIGVMQALDLGGMRHLLVGYYAPFGYTGALAIPRGGSTLALPAAVADLLIMNLAVAAGLWWKDRRHGLLLLSLAGVYMAGTFGAAEFSSALGLVVAVLVMTWAARKLHLLRYAPFGLVGAVAALWPVIEHRIAGFQNVSGLPVSWTTRWYNLKTYFWPDLSAGTHPLLGVRPSARVVVASQGTGYVWIESGYTWLLWGGGLPLVLTFAVFVWVGLRTLWPRARDLATYSSIAALATLVGLVVIAVLMVFDPHLTYRGSADLFFALLAMSSVGAAPRIQGSQQFTEPKEALT